MPYLYRLLGTISIDRCRLTSIGSPCQDGLTTVLSLTWESPYLGKTVFILRRGPGRNIVLNNTRMYIIVKHIVLSHTIHLWYRVCLYFIYTSYHIIPRLPQHPEGDIAFPMKYTPVVWYFFFMVCYIWYQLKLLYLPISWLVAFPTLCQWRDPDGYWQNQWIPKHSKTLGISITVIFIYFRCLYNVLYIVHSDDSGRWLALISNKS